MLILFFNMIVFSMMFTIPILPYWVLQEMNVMGGGGGNIVFLKIVKPKHFV